MTLQASMWTGVSGLLAHGEKMNVVGNNIANVSTVGFKGQRMDFADFVYADTFGNSGLNQIGRGVKIGTIMGNFSQGAFETTTQATDLAISGAGFFKVKKIGSDQSYYTRAGNFSFTSDGYLVDPNGLALQGWKVNNDGGVQQAAGGMNLSAIETAKKSAIIGSGAPTDIQLDTWTVLPQQTTNVTFKVNLPKDGVDQTKSSTNPFFSLLEIWDGSQPPASPNTPPMPTTAHAYQTTIQVYDEAGTKHTLTVYYDKVSHNDYQGGDSSQEIWEYVVTMDPSEDQRMYFDTASNSLVKVNTTEMGGMLMAGTMTFSGNGSMVNQTSYTWGGTQTPTSNPLSYTGIQDPADPLNELQVINLDPRDLNNWYPAAISTNGLPMFMANFSGVLDSQTCGSPSGYKYNIELDYGLKVSNSTMPWENNASIGSLAVEPYVVNPRYAPNNPLTGPQFIKLNEFYDPTLDMLTNPNSQQNVFDITGYAYTPGVGYTSGGTPVSADPGDPNYDPAFVTAYQNVLLQYKAAGTGVVIKADALGTGVPPQDFTLNTLSMTNLDGTFTPSGGIYNGTLADGSMWSIDTTTLSATELSAFNSQVQTSVTDKIRSNAPKDLSVLSAAVATNANDLAKITKPVVIDSYTCTSNGGSFSYTMSQDGYGFGDLSSYYFDAEGIMYGVYSNGVTLPLWQVCLYDFVNHQGLRREGNNLFSQTRDSGEAKSGPAGNAGLGTVSGYTLEQSNVDMATEFVYMISTQRGFQANSKVVTTTDTMLETVIQMKR